MRYGSSIEPYIVASPKPNIIVLVILRIQLHTAHNPARIY